ncbi:MAG TPA: hypothetical protein VK891_17350 [Euzebyales bacterium]|nr:hypothetical protein [Euzebyales bacterium]
MAVAHVVGGLSLDEGRLFRSHLLECSSCRARVGELRAIAHDLADVERDERRLRTAKRTETKTHESEDDTAVAAAPRISGRATLLVAAGLMVLMALSAWNFVLRGRLQQTEEMMLLLRRSVGVLQDGDAWRVGQSPVPGVDGEVATLGEDMVIMITGLTERDYGIYLLDATGRTTHSIPVEATTGMIYEYVDRPLIESAERMLLLRTDELPDEPDGAEMIEANRPPDDDTVEQDVPQVVDTVP